MFKTLPHKVTKMETDSVFSSSSIRIEMYAINRQTTTSFLCVSKHRCPSIWPWNKLKYPVTPVLISHNRTHSIISGADIQTPTHHLTVNAATCYLILFYFFIFFYFCANTTGRALVERIGLLFHWTSQFHRARGGSGTLSVGSENPIPQTLHTHPPSA